MEFSDIIYFILLVFFMILGFFNDSRKKKKQKQQQQAEAQDQTLPEVVWRPFLEEEAIPRRPPSLPTARSAADVYKNFQSSADLVSIHEEPSTLSSYTFDYDANSFYEKDTDALDISDDEREETSRRSLHPLVQSLRGDASHEELKKGLIYGEIMLRKY